MIGKYRNQAIVRISMGLLVMFAGLCVLALTDRTSARKPGLGVAIIFGLSGYVTYVFGLISWAKAKGYSSALVIGMVAVCFVCAFAPSLLLPPVVLLVLEDKTKGHRSHSRRR